MGMAAIPQIANVGFLDVDNRTVVNAVASDTLFIHGSLTGGGGTQHLAKKSSKANGDMSVLQEQRVGDAVCKAPCGTNVLAIDGASTACDDTCDLTGRYGARFDGLFCGVGDPDTFGAHCRLCYHDLDAARRQELAMINDNRTDANSHAQHVIMCDSLRPPEAADCSAKCAMKLDTVSCIFQVRCIPPKPSFCAASNALRIVVPREADKQVAFSCTCTSISTPFLH